MRNPILSRVLLVILLAVVLMGLSISTVGAQKVYKIGAAPYGLKASICVFGLMHWKDIHMLRMARKGHF